MLWALLGLSELPILVPFVLQPWNFQMQRSQSFILMYLVLIISGQLCETELSWR